MFCYTSDVGIKHYRRRLFIDVLFSNKRWALDVFTQWRSYSQEIYRFTVNVPDGYKSYCLLKKDTKPEEGVGQSCQPKRYIKDTCFNVESASQTVDQH